MRAGAPGSGGSRAFRRTRLRRTIRRNRVLLVALVAVGVLGAVLTGAGSANLGFWSTHHTGFDGPLPPNRYGTASAFDRINKEILMFGGFGEGPPLVPGGPPSVVALDQTWGQNMARGNAQGAMWTNRNPVHHPSARGFASMAFDVARHNMVLFGGAPFRSNAVSGETWIWDGIDWTLREPLAGDRPPPRQNASMVYDAHRRNVVLFGGRGANGANLRDTWIWDGSVWTKLDTGTGTADSPRASHSSAMAYDICRGEAVLFGGTEGGRNSAAVQTWTWNGTRWTNKSPFIGVQGATDPTNTPTPRYGAGMTYSYRTGRILLYGGFYASDNLFAQASDVPVATDENVWSWDGTIWRKETNNAFNTAFYGLADSHEHSMPTPRAYPLFAFGDSGSGTGFTTRVSLFGGIREDPNPAAPPMFNNDHHHYREDPNPTAALVLGPQSCVNPVPLPPEGTTATTGAQSSSTRKTVTREEIREIGQLPVLEGTDPKTVPAGTPKPDCMGQSNYGNPHLVTDPKRNRVYQFFVCEPPSAGYGQPRPLKILTQAYDGKTLKPLGSAIASMTYATNDLTISWDDMWHDVDRGRFLLQTSYYNGSDYATDLLVIQQDLIEKGINPAVTRYTVPTLPGQSTNNIPVRSLFNHPQTGRTKLLIGLTGNPPTGGRETPVTPKTPDKVVQWDLEGDGKDWESPVAACTSSYQGLGKSYRLEDAVYTSCRVSGDSNSGQWAVVRIPVTESAGNEAPGPPETFPGPGNVTRTWFDSQACRMLLLTSTFQPNGTSMWVWDCESSRYVGRVGLAQSNGVQASGSGFDQDTGRFYILVPDHKAYDTSIDTASNVVQGGLQVIDTRLTPVPQAVNFSQFSYPSAVRIDTLPSAAGLPRRVFLRRVGGYMQRYPDGGQVTLPNEMHYKVLGDELPIPQQPTFEQQDALTIPVAPSGKTDLSFDAEGSGYGMRLRRIGGIFNFSGTTDPPCGHPDRELMAGWVAEAQLSDIVASVRSLGLEADSSTKQDLQGPGSRCLIPQDFLDFSGQGPVKQAYEETLYPILRSTLPQAEAIVGPELEWSKHFNKVECVGDSSNQGQAVGADIYSSAICKQRDARVEGSARGSVAGLAAVASVGEGGSSVIVTRDPEKGVVVTSTAWASGIKLGPLSIARVETKAASWSNGRPSDAERATFSRAICGVHTPDYSVARCLTAAEQKQFVDEWNRRWGTNSKMTLPITDPNLLTGTPGGYLAGVTKPLAEQEEEKLFVRDVQKEVVGLRIVFSNVNILDLAAVRAITGFGVQCNSEFVYSPAAGDCVALPEDVFEEEEFFEEEEEFFEDEADFEPDGEWTPVDALAAGGESLGRKIGRFLQGLPVISRLPIREIGEALLAWSVWLLLSIPFLLAWRRMSLNLGGRQ